MLPAVRPHVALPAKWLLGALAFLLAPGARADDLVLDFTYGSEKDAWLKKVTESFHRQGVRLADGRSIVVKLHPMGSGQCKESVFVDAGHRLKPHLTSPASSVWVALANEEAPRKLGPGKTVIGPTRSLVRSPIVIAMWEKMARALGWGGRREIGWSDLADMIDEATRTKKGWGVRGHPEWGDFTFAHTHPELSNSGMQALIGMAYAGADKLRGLEPADINDPRLKKLLLNTQKPIIFYGESTGFLANSLVARGPEGLNAAVIYENLVIEKNAELEKKNPNGSHERLVAIYPREGTFWSDHPVGIVNREWVSPAHREAAEKYIDFLLGVPQQTLATKKEYGFRPGDVASKADIPLDPTVFGPATGTDPQRPKKILETPSRDVVLAAIDLWRSQKKRNRLVLVMDISFSMNRTEPGKTGGPSKMDNARAGALQLVKALGESDLLTLVAFNDRVKTLLRDVPLKTGRAELLDTIANLEAKGGTALHDALLEACDLAAGNDEAIQAIILLTDGADTDSTNTRDAVDKRLKDHTHPVPLIFTIAYSWAGDKIDVPDRKLLTEIAAASKAKYYDATPENLKKFVTELTTYFGLKPPD
jgi:Ca-activated chloride channel family protein